MICDLTESRIAESASVVRGGRCRETWPEDLLDTVLLVRLGLRQIPYHISAGRFREAKRQHARQHVLVQKIACQDERLGVLGAQRLEALDGLLGGVDDGGCVDVECAVVAGQVEAAERVGGVVGREGRCIVDDDARAGAELLTHLVKGRRDGFGSRQVDRHVDAGLDVEAGLLARCKRDPVALRGEGFGDVCSDLDGGVRLVIGLSWGCGVVGVGGK